MKFTRTPIQRFEVLEGILLGVVLAILAYLIGTAIGGGL